MNYLSFCDENLKGRDLFIFGAGTRGRDILVILEDAGFVVSGFFDNNPELIGTTVFNLPVFGVDDPLLKAEDSIVIISPRNNQEIIIQLGHIGVMNVIDGQELYLHPIRHAENDYSAVVPFNHYVSSVLYVIGILQRY